MLVNFLVISKRPERVAEVAARFALDAMPGRPMSVNADRRADAFDLEEARKKRLELVRESQLFVSTDGIEDTAGSTVLSDFIPMMLDRLFCEVGVRFPGPPVRGHEGDLRPGSCRQRVAWLEQGRVESIGETQSIIDDAFESAQKRDHGA